MELNFQTPVVAPAVITFPAGWEYSAGKAIPQNQIEDVSQLQGDGGNTIPLIGGIS